MISFARATSVTPGSCTSSWSPVLPYTEMFGSVTPSSLTRRSIVVRACTTACSRIVRSMFGFSLNSYAPPAPGLRS